MVCLWRLGPVVRIIDRHPGGQAAKEAEVDFVLGDGEVALEVKGASHVDKRDFVSLNAFIEDYSPRKTIVICKEREKRIHGSIKIMPWRSFLEDLWEGKIIR